jgi:hypothetical protein
MQSTHACRCAPRNDRQIWLNFVELCESFAGIQKTDAWQLEMNRWHTSDAASTIRLLGRLTGGELGSLRVSLANMQAGSEEH